MTPDPTAAAYDWCRQLARQHYENFPVASWLLPTALRQPIAAIYAFARVADDIADEDKRPAPERLADLAGFGRRLDAALAGAPETHPALVAAADAIRRHRLPVALFHDLLSAFSQDVTRTRYATFAELADYARRSANPVGRLLLHLTGTATPDNLRDSDTICSALQYINFWQDLAQDVSENDRLYVPQEDLARHGVAADDLLGLRRKPAVADLMRFQAQRAHDQLLAGAALGQRLPGRLGVEIRCTIEGGLALARALLARDDPYARPRLRRRDWLGILWRGLRG